MKSKVGGVLIYLLDNTKLTLRQLYHKITFNRENILLDTKINFSIAFKEV